MDLGSKMNYDVVYGLVKDLHLLNRVHNGDEFEKAIFTINDWIKKNGFRGKTRILEYKPGEVFNHWRVPKRWIVKDFWVKDPSGRVLLDKKSHPLALVPFSDPFKGEVDKEELLKHVHNRQDLPDAFTFIFRKMYKHWEKGWGISLPFNQAQNLKEGRYSVYIDAEFVDKPMQMLEYTLPGESDSIVALSAHLDHPGMVNDSVSGCVGGLAALAQLEKRYAKTYFTYSMLICPEIIGSAVYLEAEPKMRKKMVACLCPNMVTHDAPLVMCHSKSGKSHMDKSLLNALAVSGDEYRVGIWREYPDAGDEVSYDAPGFDIPTVTLTRVGEMFKLYHTSHDTPEIMKRDKFEKAIDVMTETFSILEEDFVPVRNFQGNPCLSNPDINLYLEPLNVSNQLNTAAVTNIRLIGTDEVACLRSFMDFFLSNLEGEASVLDIAHASRMPFSFVKKYAEAFLKKGLARSKGRPFDQKEFSSRIVQTSVAKQGYIAKEAAQK